MKTKILFMVINMNVGGTEKALINMVSDLPEEKYEITVLLLEQKGNFINDLPGHVFIDYIESYKEMKKMIHNSPKQIIHEFAVSGRWLKAIGAAAIFTLSKLRKERTLLYKYLLRKLPVIEKKYDIAVAYAGPMDLISYFIVHKVKSEKKIQWIHFDISEIGFNQKFASKVYRSFDRIFTVSREGRQKLVNKLPELNGKVDVFPNLLSSQLIAGQSLMGGGFTDRFGGIRILTVGRLSPEKGQDMAIIALSKLIKAGYNVKWYCLGDGKLKADYMEMASDFGVNGQFILLGEDTNPYPYIKNCDIYVQPSRHEGYCITLAEARMLNKPIVTTDFTGAKEQIANGETGLIVKTDANALFLAVKKLIANPQVRMGLSKNLRNESRKHRMEITKLHELL